MPEWFEDWFNEEYLLLYQNRNSQDAADQVSLVESCNFLTKDSKILEIGCGAGRYLNLFYQKGYSQIFGIDLSEVLLQKALLLNQHLNVKRCDMRDFEENYDVIFSFFTSFGYFDDQQNIDFLKKIFNQLNQGGIFWLDFFNSQFVEKNLKFLTQKKIGQKKITEKRKIENNRVNKKIIIFDKITKQQKEFEESVAFYSKEKLEVIFEEIGFKKLKIFGDYSGNDFSQNSPRAIFYLSK